MFRTNVSLLPPFSTHIPHVQTLYLLLIFSCTFQQQMNTAYRQCSIFVLHLWMYIFMHLFSTLDVTSWGNKLINLVYFILYQYIHVYVINKLVSHKVKRSLMNLNNFYSPVLYSKN